MSNRDWAVKPLGDFAWPITWRWHMRAPWGDTRQEFTVDAPELYGGLQESIDLGLVLWQLVIAPAISGEVKLIVHDTVCWRLAPAAVPMSHAFERGGALGTPAARANSPVVMMHTGHLDAMALRRLYFPGAPSTWVAGGLMTPTGLGRLEGHMQGVYIGLARELTGAPMRWLIRYPDLLPATAENPSGVSFRLVEYLRIVHHVDRAPDPSGEPWP